MAISVVGVNHQRAPVEMRERLAFSPGEVTPAIERLASDAGVREIVLLSTCNRTELYLADPREAPDAKGARAALCRMKQIDDGELDGRFYTYEEQKAVEHLFRVASGLDAMVLGETQIIGQVRDAYRAALEAGKTGRFLNPLFQRALHVAGRVHSETAIGRGGASVPSAAARLAGRIFESLERRRLMVVGAGEMGLLTITSFRQRGMKNLIVANRTEERARALGEQYGGRGIALDQIGETLAETDIVVSCLESKQPVITPDEVGAALNQRRGEPMLLLDLGVPRNIDPGANRFENVYLFDIDDLQSIVGQSILERRSEVLRSMEIITHEADQFMTTANLLWIEELIKAMRDHFHHLGQEELLKIKDPSARQEMEDHLRRVINKILHTPTVELKKSFEVGNPSDVIRRIFGLK